MNNTKQFLTHGIPTVLSLFLLSACGGGGSGSVSPPPPPPPVAPVTAAIPALSYSAVKNFHFSWTDVSDATHYKLLENPDSSSGFLQVGSDIPQGTQSLDHVVPLYARLNAQYLLQSCNASGCTDSSPVTVSGALVDSIGYVKASNTGAENQFGYAVSLSGDGNTLAVGAYFENSAATGIDGDQNDDSLAAAGAVYVFTRSGMTWNQQAYIKASNAGESDQFGAAVSLSEDGDTLAVGALGEGSDANGVSSDGTGEDNNDAVDAGAVYVFTRAGNQWSQQAYVKASNSDTEDQFGEVVSLSRDGDTLAVGARLEDSNGVLFNQNNQADDAGAVYVYSRAGSSWAQQAYIKANSDTVAAGVGDQFGRAIALSADGDTLAVGATEEDALAVGINSGNEGNDLSDDAEDSGAVYVFTRTNTLWTRQAYVKASNTGAGDRFGRAVSLSANGNSLAVGANFEDSNAMGIDGDQTDDNAGNAGAVYVYSRDSAGAWASTPVYIKASNTDITDVFGSAVSLSGDGDILAVGAWGENSSAVGISGDQADDNAGNSGAVYLFIRDGGSWRQQAYVKSSNTGALDLFGVYGAVSLSNDGSALAVGAFGEASNATGIDGDQSDNSVSNAGAVYLY